MAGSVNKVILVGNVGKDPEEKTTSHGKFAVFSVATSETWRDKQSGERREKTEWHNITVYNEILVEKVVMPYVKKGAKVYIEGQLETRKWQDNSGADRYSTSVVLKGYAAQIQLLGDGRGARDDADSGQFARTSAPARSTTRREDHDDEIPF